MRWLAHEQFAPAMSEGDLREELELLVRAARDLGVRAEDVQVDRVSGRAVGVFVAPDADAVRDAHARAGIGCGDVFPAEAWDAGLVLPPRT